MPNIFHEQKNVGDVLKYEAQTKYSRDGVVVAKGQHLLPGTVVAFDANGKVVQVQPAATDSKKTPIGIMIEEVDAIDSEVRSFVIARHAAVADTGVVYPKDATAAQINTINSALKAEGILLRTTA